MSKPRFPDWARSKGNQWNPLSVEDQNRIRLNAGRICASDLAKFMRCSEQRIRHWAKSQGITVTMHKHNYPLVRKSAPGRKPVQEVGVERMIELAFRGRA